MRPISEFVEQLASQDLDGFLRSDPPSMLVADISQYGYHSPDGTPGETQVRLLFRAEAKSRRAAGHRDRGRSAYMVFPVQAREQENQDRLLVGCSGKCDIRIEEASVSREHAWIEKIGDRYFIEDNRSTAGTMLDGVQLKPSLLVELKPWSRVTLGLFDMTFFDPVGFYQFVRKFGSA